MTKVFASSNRTKRIIKFYDIFIFNYLVQKHVLHTSISKYYKRLCT